jgi:hypothetical protein
MLASFSPAASPDGHSAGWPPGTDALSRIPSRRCLQTLASSDGPASESMADVPVAGRSKPAAVGTTLRAEGAAQCP